MQRILTLLLILLSLPATLQAQKQESISLETVLERLEQSNYDVLLSDKSYNAAKADYRKSNANFLPSLSVSHTGISTTNPLMAFGSKLNREILTQNDFNPQFLNDPDAIGNFVTKIELLQPIFNADGLQMRKALKNQMEAKQLQHGRTKDYLKLEVSKVYMQLQLSYALRDVLIKAQQTALENKKVANNHFDQGYLKKSDLLTVEIHVSDIQTKLIQAETAIQNLSDLIQFMMGQNDDVLLYPSSPLTKASSPNNYESILSEERADIIAMQKNKSSAEHMYKANKMGLLPRLNAFASYEMYDKNLGGMDAGGYLVGAQISWSIFEGYKRVGAIQKSKIELEMAELNLEKYKRQSQLELSSSRRKLLEKEQAIKLKKLATEQAEASLRIITNRFDQGLEKTTELLQTETMLLQQQLAYQQAVYDYNYTKSQIEYLTK